MRETRSLVAIWLALLALLTVSLAGSFVFTGMLNLGVSLGTAAIKAALIYWFYMHLKEQSGLNRIAALGAVAWLLILVLMLGTDYATRL
jgi:cytochrome c oxidase subunit 4